MDPLHNPEPDDYYVRPMVMVRAQQFHGQSAGERPFEEDQGARYQNVMGTEGKPELKIAAARGWTRVKHSDWIVLWESGAYEIVEAYAFERDYTASRRTDL